jgi:PAS domain S-box-containing protein
MAEIRTDDRSELLARRFAVASRIMGGVVVALGVAALAGWALDVPALRSGHPHLTPMKPNAAVLFVLLGTALALGRALGARRRVAVMLLASLSVLVGAVTLAEYALGLDLVIDGLLLPPRAALAGGGRISLVGSLSFLLAGSAVALTLGCRRPIRAARWAGMCAFGLALLPVTGYATGVVAWYQVRFLTPVSLPGAVGLLLASSAVLIARTDGGVAALLVKTGTGGVLARRLIPLALVLPVALDFVIGDLLPFAIPPTVVSALHAVSLTAVLAFLSAGLAGRLERANEDERRALAALRASEGRYRALFQNMAAGFAYHRMIVEDGVLRDAVLVEVNAALARQAGIDPEAVIGRPVTEAVPGFKEGARTFFERYLEVLRTGAPVQFEYLSPPTGRWYGISAYSPEPGHFATVFHDITESKRREEEASQHLEVLRHLGNDVLILLTLEGDIVQVNDRALEVYGYSEEELLRLNVRDLRAPETVPDVPGRLQQAGAPGGARFETVQRRRDGSTFPVEVSTRKVELGGRFFFQSIVRDLTERRRAEAELRRAQEKLVQSQKMEAVGRLASGIAHDFNNLLAVIQSCSRSLREGLRAGELREDADEIWQAGDRGAQLVRRLLAFARRGPSEPVPTDVSAVAREFEPLMRRTLGEDVSLSLSLEELPWLTRVDPRELEQVLMNLVVNAREAMPAGGEIRIATSNLALERPPPGCVDLSPGRWVVVTVADTGTGIAPALLPSIFEPFFTTKQGKGAGLGLATVNGIVQEAGGRIAVESSPNRGARFTVYLPACDPSGKADAPQPAAPAPPRPASTVLLVEDDASVRRATRRMLARGGFEVLEASNAVEALRRLREDRARIDVVVSDVVMPDVRGTDLAMVLSELHPGMPVVLVSGYAAGHDDLPPGRTVLAKPFSQEELFARIEEALPGARRAAGAQGARREGSIDAAR